MKIDRGSRKHILDWVTAPNFAAELTELLRPSGAIVEANDQWLPKGHQDRTEARLETFGPAQFPGPIDWPALSDWWLVHKDGATTPNWDLAATCSLPIGRGLVLVEAKANDKEMKEEGKPLKVDASQHSTENHERIGAAIREAREQLGRVVPGVMIDRDREYQLSNRVAYAWKLASMGLPTVLVFLGFLGDTGIRDAGGEFRDEPHWFEYFERHAQPVAPKPLFDKAIDCGRAPMWVMVRSRRVIEPSPTLAEARRIGAAR